MNRLILVGNGFDLAHGLRTSYRDFISYYLAKVFDSFGDNGNRYEDPLIRIALKPGAFNLYIPQAYKVDVNSYLDDFITRHSNQFDIWISPFLTLTRANLAEKNWVDIEMDYFQCLRHCFKNSQPEREAIKILNHQLDFVKQELTAFLSEIETTQSDIPPDQDLLALFTQPILWDDISTTVQREDIDSGRFNSMYYMTSKVEASETMIVNFNYTNTLEKYFTAIEPQLPNTSLNYIHGRLSSKENEPIFGFGDEYDKTYIEFEAYNENSLFEHVKSFRYFLTNNNKDLLRFVGSDLFQVFILGHSCGLTDRTMLKSIFENENCRSIKIFHHNRRDGSNDYHEKTIELGRHFSDKGYMRKVIVDYHADNYMPQPLLKLPKSYYIKQIQKQYDL